MARSTFVGSFIKRTGAGSQSITGLGFQPKALVFWSVDRTAQDGFEAADQRQIFGLSDGTHHSAVSHVVQNGGVFDAANGHRNDAALIIVDLDDSLNSSGVVSSLDADGFTINWTTATSHDGIYINFLAVGGSDVQAFVGDVSTNSSTGSQAVTGVGFQPDCVIFLPFDRSSAATSAAGGFGPNGIGWMTATAQGALCNDSVSGARLRYQRTDRCCVLRGASGSFDQEAQAVSLDADGFTVNWLTAHTGRLPYLALKGFDVFAGHVEEPTTDGTTTIATDGTSPLAVLLMGVGNGLSTSTNNGDECSFGAADSAGHHQVGWSADRVGSPDVTARYQSNAAAHISANASSSTVTTLQGLATVSVLTESVVLNWTIPDVSPDPSGGSSVLYLILGAPLAAGGEQTFDDGTVSTPLTYFNWHHDTGQVKGAEVDLCDRDLYYGGLKPAIVLSWKPITRGLSDKSGQMEHQSFGATVSDTTRTIRGMLDTDASRYFPNRPWIERMIDDEQRRVEGVPRMVANGFISTYSPDPDLTFSFDCVGWPRRKFTRQRKSQLAWQPIYRVEDFDPNTTPSDVLNRPAPVIYGSLSDLNQATTADSVHTVYLPDPTAPSGTVNGAPGTTTTWRYYFTAMNGQYGVDPRLQPWSDHRGETYFASVDVASAPDDAALQSQANAGGAASYWVALSCTSADATAVRVYRGLTDGTGIKGLAYAEGSAGTWTLLDGKNATSGDAIYYAGIDAKPPIRNNTYIPGTLSGGNVTTDTGSGAFQATYTGLRLSGGVHYSEFAIAAHYCTAINQVYVGGVRVGASDLSTYFTLNTAISYSGFRYCTIHVDRAYAIANGIVSSDELAQGDNLLTVNVDGIEDVGDGTGTLITNLFDQAKHFCENALAPDRPFNTQDWVGASPIEFSAVPGLTLVDATSFDALAAANSITGAGAIGAFREEIGAMDALALFLISGDFQVGESRKGQLLASREPDEVPTSFTTLTDVINITERSFRISDGVLSDFFNILPYRYGRDLSGRSSGGPLTVNGLRLVLAQSDGWQSTADGVTFVEDTASQFNFDQEISAPQMDLHFIRDASVAIQIVSRVLNRYSFPLRRVTLTVPLSGTSVDLGDVFGVTDIEGIGASGWTNEPLLCERHILDPNTNSVTLSARALLPISNRITAPETGAFVTTADGIGWVTVP